MHDYIEQGGIFLWPIIICSIWAVTLLIERMWFFNVTAARFHKDVSLEFQKLEHKNVYEVRHELKGKKGLVEEILLAAWNPLNKNISMAEREVEEVIYDHVPELEKHLSTIATLAGVQPLLGLLGTITGMITVFAVITSEGGSVDASALAGGISEAMITTQAGLCASVPILIAHTFLKNRFKRMMSILKGASTKAIKELENHVVE